MKRSQFITASTSIVVAALFGPQQPGAFAQTDSTATLTAVTARFHVDNHQLDTDSTLRLMLSNSERQDVVTSADRLGWPYSNSPGDDELIRAYGIYGYTETFQGSGDWMNGKNPGPFSFYVATANPLTFSDYGGAFLFRAFRAVGNNDCTYDMHLRFDWSDNTSTRLVVNGIVEQRSPNWMRIPDDFSTIDNWGDKP